MNKTGISKLLVWSSECSEGAGDLRFQNRDILKPHSYPLSKIQRSPKASVNQP